MQFGFIFALIVSILISVFAIQNANMVSIDLFFASFQISQAVVILVSVAVGAIIAVILGSVRQIKGMSNTKDIKNKLKLFESENAQLNQDILTYESDIEVLRNEKTDQEDQLAKLRVEKSEYQGKIDELKVQLNEKQQYIEKQQIALEQQCTENDNNVTSENENIDNAYLEEENEKGQTES
ncbi:DUF1049 domain-containing protein [Sedimentibacter sp. zth1]|uniref:LapA family protein n=1 Tax=Sedimentibacter sp. zth1 TaxID=2816908 RepID=UPI001A917016|nr:LapA family protein [Sedimentibacter sp. zth1]QSX06330.1 DUF1049 domain-containing protein [Sedimentibacter sp. zth1]